MKKHMLTIAILALSFTGIQAQKYFTRDGKISFHSDSPLEKIEANNTAGTCVVDAGTGNLEFAVLIKAFKFEKALMQEHFNENYMESSKYPKATFKGALVNKSEVNFAKDGTYKAKVKGNMTIHGVTNPIESTVVFVVKGSTVSASTDFNITVADYKIEIPSLVKDNIAKVVQVVVKTELEELKS